MSISYTLSRTANPDVSPYAFFADALTNAVQIKSTAGMLYVLDLMNSAAATTYLQVFFQPISAVTLGTTLPDMIIKVPTNAGSGFTKTIYFAPPMGGQIAPGGSLGPTSKGKGAGLTIASTTSPTGATAAAMGVTAIYS